MVVIVMLCIIVKCLSDPFVKWFFLSTLGRFEIRKDISGYTQRVEPPLRSRYLSVPIGNHALNLSDLSQHATVEFYVNLETPFDHTLH
jgi:hypothetical protein